MRQQNKLILFQRWKGKRGVSLAGDSHDGDPPCAVIGDVGRYRLLQTIRCHVESLTDDQEEWRQTVKMATPSLPPIRAPALKSFALKVRYSGDLNFSWVRKSPLWTPEGVITCQVSVGLTWHQRVLRQTYRVVTVGSRKHGR